MIPVILLNKLKQKQKPKKKTKKPIKKNFDNYILLGGIVFLGIISGYLIFKNNE